MIEERIGVGGFGEVFRARQPLIGSEVAIKVLHPTYSADPESVARFVAEARAVNQISHAGIVLRAQVPAPAPPVRAPVSALLVDAYRAVLAASYADRDQAAVDAAMARLAAVARELEALDPPAAALPVFLRAEMLGNHAWEYASRLPTARAAIADAIARISATRDDAFLASAYALEAGFEAFVERDGDRLARAADALERATQAGARAGNPRFVRRWLAGVRGSLAAERGDDEAAAAAWREETALDPDPWGATDPYEIELAAIGRPGDAVAAARRDVEAATARFGEAHAVTAMEHFGLSLVLEATGDLAGALAEARRYAALERQLGTPSYMMAWGAIREAELALRVGQASDADVLAAVHALAGQGTTPPRQSADGIATARRAGLFTVFARAAELEVDGGSDEALDAAAELAFARGDDAELARRTAEMTARCARKSCDDWIRISRWLSVLVDARSHRGGDVDARLAELERAYGGDRQARAFTGTVLASLGRWDDARAKLEQARAIPNVWERHAELVEVDAWLGLARLRAGDATGARASLEEAICALAIRRNGLDGFTYMTPVAELALARMLPDADRPRARRLATRARDGFARLGPHHQSDVDDAARWLAEHP